MKGTARAISSGVYQILSDHPMGNVHSVFNNSFNLIFGERLVHVGSSENGLSPFGISLNQNDANHITRQLSTNQQVAWDASSNTLMFMGGRSISLEHSTSTDHYLLKNTFDPAIVRSNSAFVGTKLRKNDWETGIAQTGEEQEMIFHYLLSNPSSANNHLLPGKMAALESLARGEQTVDPNDIFDFWIGRGPGLTPSGDDLITGMCAMLSVLQGLNDSFQEQLQTYLWEKGQKRTTSIGCEYLIYASEQQYHTHIIKMCRALLKPQKATMLIALEQMEKIGHTSGADTLAGILLGIKIATTAS